MIDFGMVLLCLAMAMMFAEVIYMLWGDRW